MAKKLFYKIGEACKKVDVQPYVLRYWETEFDLLSPDKSKSGQRVYTDDDLAIIRRIKELLYDEGYTTVGAKKKLQSELAEGQLGSASGAGPESAKTKKASPKAASSKGSSKKLAPAKKPASEPAKSSKAKADAAANSDANAGAKPEQKADSPAGAESEQSGRAEELEAGLRTALDQARGILDLLG